VWLFGSGYQPAGTVGGGGTGRAAAGCSGTAGGVDMPAVTTAVSSAVNIGYAKVLSDTGVRPQKLWRSWVAGPARHFPVSE